MSHDPAVTPPVTPAGGPPPPRTPEPRATAPRGRRWPGPRRRALAYLVGTGLVAGAGVAIQACADGGVAPTSPAPTPQLDAPAPGPVETGKGVDGGAGLPFDPALVGELHNRGLGVVLTRALQAGEEHRVSGEAQCALVARLTAEYAIAERARDARLAAIGTGGLTDAELAGIAKQTACGVERFAQMSLGEAAVSAAGGTVGRQGLSDDGGLSPAAADLLNQVNDAIRWMNTAAILDRNLMPLQVAADALPDLKEQLLVRETIETARASAYFHETFCRDNPTACGGDDRPPDATRTSREYRTGINSEVVFADAMGCVMGGIKGLAGGPPGILSGCFWGGVAGSGQRIFRYIFLHQ
jgi:hypothetical protein